MRNSQERLRSLLRAHGWQIVTETAAAVEGEGRYATAWWLASLTPPQGRRVLIEFRVHTWEVDYWYGADWRRVVHYCAAVRFPTAIDSPEAVLEDHVAESAGFRQLFRVLEWFRDPTSGVLYRNADESDWFPPWSWDPAHWQPGTGLESCWDATTTVGDMLHFVAPHLGERKLRLLTCAICRQLPVTGLDEKNRRAIEAAERYAEGLTAKRELKKASKVSALRWLGQLEPREGLDEAIGCLRREDPPRADGTAAAVLREIVGNPFHQVPVRHEWLRVNDGVVLRLAEEAAMTQDFTVLPVLADALEDAGCRDPALLAHCRQEEPHLRGCWAVHLLTGRK